MPVISQRRLHSTIQARAADALETLAASSAEILAQWRQELVGLALKDEGLVAEGPLDLKVLAKQVRKCSYTVFQERIQEYGGKLAQRGVKLDRTVAALNRLFEIGVLYLGSSESKGEASKLALSRLHALVVVLVVSGYAANEAAGKPAPTKADLSDAEDQRHGASAYVTKVYEEERQRLSRDLHDEVGHDLILIKLYLEMIALDTNGKEFSGIRPRLAEAISLVSHAIDSVRRLVLDLGPAVFDDLGFLPAVRTYTTQFSARTKIPLTLREGYVPDDIPMSHQVAMYRLLQGALSNVLKHAFAKNVKVSLGSMKDAVLVMVIEDDGIGFDTTARPGRRSFGLTAMRERVEVLGGRIHIQSRPNNAFSKNRGTRIEVDLPLPGGAK